MNFDDILFKAPTTIAEIAHFFRKIILDIDPQLEEGIYGGQKVRMALYHIERTDNPALGIAASETHCQIFIHHFAAVNTEGLKLQGKGKHARHLKFFKKSEIEEAKMRKLFAEVVAIVKTKI